MSETDTIERHEFGAEVGRLLDLVVHALYSDREIFLRELVANAADAIDRRRFAALTDQSFALPEDAAVRVVPDKDSKTLTLSDPGVGMSKDELAKNLGTIARSGTRAFGQSIAEAKPEDRPSLIGQFGVGFYSAFMVADRVEVTSRALGSEDAWTWASTGKGDYTLAPATRDAVGTTIVMHMKDDADEYLESYRLETVIRKWADHITIPIKIARDGEDVAANEGTALWRKPKAEVTEENYKDFYRHLGHYFDEPWSILHWRAEGAMEFSALLFVPSAKPFDAVEGPRESRVRLHVRRMFITDEAGLLPPWLRFVTGVVDTEDLPLNVSREMLQSTPVLARIRKAVTNRVIGELKTKAKDAESYGKFWEAFGSVMKEAMWDDADHRSDVIPLLRFKSSTQDGWVSFEEYVSRMKPEQDAIYVLVGDDTDTLAKSPQLEGFRARGVEVLLLPDQVDAFWPERAGSILDKSIRSITQGQADLSKIPLEGEAVEEPADVTDLIAALKTALGADVSDVRATDRLVDSAVVLAASASGPDLQMQRLLKRAGRVHGASAPILEINPRHKLIRTLAGRTELDDAPGMLLDLARVQDGEAPRDPAGFARQMAAALAASLA